MSPQAQFVVSFSLLVGPTAAGYVLRRRMESGPEVEGEAGPRPGALARRIQVLNMIFLTPVLALMGIWFLHLRRDLLLMPVVGLSLAVLPMFAGVLISGVRKMPPKPKGSYVFAAGLSNIGTTLGGFLCYLLISPQSYAISLVFWLYFMFFSYLVCFPLARAIGAGTKFNFHSGAIAAVTDVRSMPLVGIAIGFAMLLGGVRHPAGLRLAQDILMPLSTALAMFALGLTFRFRAVGRFWKLGMEMSAIKFLLTPALAAAAVWLLGLHGEQAKVVMLLSSMPVAIYTCIIATVFDLDIDLANAMFLITTGVFLVAVLPILVFVM